MKIKNHISAFVKFLVQVIVMAAILFLTAGTISYTNGWLLLGVFFIPTLIIRNLLAIKDPELNEKRKDGKETRSEQKSVLLGLAAIYYLGIIISGLSFRFGWCNFPEWVVIVGAILVVLGNILWGEVARENHYLTQSIKKQDEQKLIDTGVYGIVRHPLYFANLIIFMSMPLVLGSILGFIVTLTFPFLFMKRIKDEEVFLEEELKDYKEYKTRVKYRLIPFIW